MFQEAGLDHKMLRRSISGTPDWRLAAGGWHRRPAHRAANPPPMHCMRDQFATTVRPHCATLARQAFSLN
jgi:hypothetical protein